MDQLPCPGCRTLLNMEDTSCPICLRPRSKYEITRAYAELREAKARARRRPFIVLAVLLAAGGAGREVYLRRAALSSAASSAYSRVSAFAARETDPRNLR